MIHVALIVLWLGGVIAGFVREFGFAAVLFAFPAGYAAGCAGVDLYKAWRRPA